MSRAYDAKLRAQTRLDAKWLKADIQNVFEKEGLSRLWNDLVRDGEVASCCNSDGLLNGGGVLARKGETGLYYCGMRTLACSCCEGGQCGPERGCNCTACQKLDKEEEDRMHEDGDPPQLSHALMEGWTWGPQPNVSELHQCLRSILHEQQSLGAEAAGSTLFASQLRQRLLVLQRYFMALARHNPTEARSPLRKKQNLQANLSRQKSAMKPTEKASLGLARVGSRAALSFAFAFLRRAWRSGEDADLCSELLQESLDAMRSLPEGTLFEEGVVSNVWLEVVERAAKFLRSVVDGDMGQGPSSSKTNKVPVQDQQTALALLLELAVQRGSLSHILGAILLLLNLWTSSRHLCDNRLTTNLTSAPLLPLLHRFTDIQGLKKPPTHGTKLDECSGYLVSPTECFLRFLHLPDDDTMSVDLRQCAVVIMSHLDRLGLAYMPPQDIHKSPMLTQEVLGWGWLALGTGASSTSIPQVLAPLSDVGDIQQMACSETCLLVLTRAGKVLRLPYASDTQALQVVPGLTDKEVTKIASHAEGKHCMALTTDGEVYSWGNGDGGRLGHGDNSSCEAPTLVTALVGKGVCHIGCGSSYSAAVTTAGELYTWGRGNYGRLGHGSSEDQPTPLVLAALKGHVVTDVCCGSGDAQTLAIVDNGLVYSWGDGDYGKLGRGGSDGCKAPVVIDKLRGHEVTKVLCGAQFSVALTKTGSVFTWGKGDHYRLGQGTDEHIRHPKQVECLKERKVVDVSVGSMHCMALTDDGDVYTWGRNDQGQLGDAALACKAEPSVMGLLQGKNIVGITCGPSQSFVWSSSSQYTVSARIPFVVDVCPRTFELLDELLGEVCEGLDGRSDWPPPQEHECLAVAGLNLLNLQLYAAICQNENPLTLGLAPGGSLVGSLKRRVVALASNSGVITTVQKAAQSVLQNGWSLLLPTPEERARALSTLLPTGGRDGSVLGSGQRFMTDLLVSSLMADGGLESALDAAFRKETRQLDEIKVRSTSQQDDSDKADDASGGIKSQQAALETMEGCPELDIDSERASIPLLQLVQQLLRNASTQTLQKLKTLSKDPQMKTEDAIGGASDASTSLDLLARFQRLLVAKLFCVEENRGKGIASDPDPDVLGGGCLLRKYLLLLSAHVADVLPIATSLAVYSSRHFANVARIIAKDVSGVLLPEMCACLVLLQSVSPTVLHLANVVPMLQSLLDILDTFNQLAPGLPLEDADNMAWPNVNVSNLDKVAQRVREEVPQIRKADLENHNKDGGLWVVIQGKVYDIQDFKAQAPGEQTARDTIESFEQLRHSEGTQDTMQTFFIGNFVDPEHDIVQSTDTSTVSSPLMDTERTLGYLLGQHCSSQARSTPLSTEEVEYKHWLESKFFAGGLQLLTPQNPFEEEKGESRTPSSCTTTPGTTPTLEHRQPPQQIDKEKLFSRQASQSDIARPFLQSLAESRMLDASVRTLLEYVERYCRSHHLITPIEFPSDHPVEEVGRLLMAVLLKHHDLGHVALGLVEHGLSESGHKHGLPRSIAEVCKVVYQAKRSLIKAHQDLGRSYKEVCAPVIERCHFLFNELRPTIGNEVNAFSRSRLLKSIPRWKRVTQKLIEDIKKKKVPTATLR